MIFADTHLTFKKVHGAGNDFLLLDQRLSQGVGLDMLSVESLANRQTGIGFDQLIWLETSAEADLAMRIVNADGSEVAACGNATRCVAWLLMQESGKTEVTIRTKAGFLRGRQTASGVIVDMGQPQFNWAEIPLASEQPTNEVRLDDALPPAFCVSMGNPHAVFFVSDAQAVNLAHWGPLLENHPMLPERANVSFASIAGPEEVTLRVWERGAGVTLACGTAACATLVAAVEKRLIPGRKARLNLPGGVLPVEWDAEGHVWLGGPVAVAFTGEFRIKDYLRTS